jgi:hypothetical protein
MKAVETVTFRVAIATPCLASMYVLHERKVRGTSCVSALSFDSAKKYLVSRDSVVGIAIGCGLDGRRSEFESRERLECSLLEIRTSCGGSPASLPMCTR